MLNRPSEQVWVPCNLKLSVPLAISVVSIISFSNITSSANTVMDAQCPPTGDRPTSSQTVMSNELRNRLEKQLREHDKDAVETWSDYFFAMNLESSDADKINEEKKLFQKKFPHPVTVRASNQQLQNANLLERKDAKDELAQLREKLAQIPCGQQKAQRQEIYQRINVALGSPAYSSSACLLAAESSIESMFCDSNPDVQGFNKMLYGVLWTLKNNYCARVKGQKVLTLAFEKGLAAAQDASDARRMHNLIGPAFYLQLLNYFPADMVLSYQKRLDEKFTSLQSDSDTLRQIKFRLACSYLSCHKPEEARKVLLAALRLPKQADALLQNIWFEYLLAECYLREKKFGDCERILGKLRKSISTDEKWQQEHYAYLNALESRLYVLTKQKHKALEYLREAERWFGGRFMQRDPISEQEEYLSQILPDENYVLNQLLIFQKDIPKSWGISPKEAIEKLKADKLSNDKEMASRKFRQSIASGDIGEPGELQRWFSDLDRQLLEPDAKDLVHSAEKLKQNGDLPLASKILEILSQRAATRADPTLTRRILRDRIEVELALGQISSVEILMQGERNRLASDPITLQLLDYYETEIAWLNCDMSKLSKVTLQEPLASSVESRQIHAEQQVQLARCQIANADFSTAKDNLIEALQNIPGPLEASALLALCFARTGNLKRADSILDALRNREAINSNNLQLACSMFFLDKTNGAVAELKANPMRALRYYTQASSWLNKSTFKLSPQGEHCRKELDSDIARVKAALNSSSSMR